MKECCIKERGFLTDELGNEIKLIYGIVTGNVMLGGMFAETYGVSVTAESRDEMTIEIVEDVTPSLSEALELIKKLREFQVTPTTLRDIIDDHIEN